MSEKFRGDLEHRCDILADTFASPKKYYMKNLLEAKLIDPTFRKFLNFSTRVRVCD